MLHLEGLNLVKTWIYTLAPYITTPISSPSGEGVGGKSGK